MDNPSYIVDYPFLLNNLFIKIFWIKLFYFYRYHHFFKILFCKITIQNKHDLHQDGKGNLDLYRV